MPFIPVPNTLKIAMEYTLNGQLVVNVYYAEKSTPIAFVNLTEIAAVFLDWWDVVQSPNFSNDIALNQIVVTDLTTASGWQVIEPVSPTIPGTQAVASASNQVAIVVTHGTSFIGRHNRGRTYYAGIAAGEVTDNFIGSTRQAALLAAEVSLDAEIVTAGLFRVVVSKVVNGVPRTTGQTTPIVEHHMNTRVDTQRRRLPGTGA